MNPKPRRKHDFLASDAFRQAWKSLEDVDRRVVTDLIAWIDEYPLSGHYFRHDLHNRKWYVCLAPDLSLGVVYRLQDNVIHVLTVYVAP